jgi:hypothetical protein
MDSNESNGSHLCNAVLAVIFLSKITVVKTDFHASIMAVREIKKKKMNSTEAIFLCHTLD